MNKCQLLQQRFDLKQLIISLDGNHIRIKAPPNMLLAVADADGPFLSVDIGEYGRNSDGRVLKESSFGKALFRDQLQLPEPAPLPGEESVFPFYFVADEAFPLSCNIMKPYPRRQLTNERRIFNYRLSRGRKSVECAFGMLTSKFRLLETPIGCDVSKFDSIILAVCVLHNFIRNNDGVFGNPIVHHIVENSPKKAPSNSGNRQRPANTPLDLRNRLFKFFLHPNGSLPYQNKHCVE
ncbi:hypothetical protein J437_LFUL014973 [Ladona fulva]|uniref:DDE Tnp4 domain-containing protein n=1 Tax=Ladona fulva TaxID=123851 RepID=A0A8K0P9I3_LADFU|nr:hypothetical protein J437_LFUL014973 [Ladona fulva]